MVCLHRNTAETIASSLLEKCSLYSHGDGEIRARIRARTDAVRSDSCYSKVVSKSNRE